MVGFTSIALALAAAAPSLAAPRGAMNFTLPREQMRSLQKRSDTNYKQDYTTGGTVNFTPGTNEFSINWDTTEDFVCGVGWNPGSDSPITHTGTFSIESGLGSLSVYGWTTDPLVEYYIMECSEGLTNSGSQKGTVTSDGGSYTIWENQRVNEPSIEGTSTFNQYISVRDSCTSNGTVTVENHFKAWASAGLQMGTMNFQVIAVESWDGSGTADQTVTN
ncbi:endo-beta-1,4-xylanase [Xylariaceae sp. FL0804]|nr:endo-beta-1,4-xylanase [Xylariaceae sp. FL0804]